MSGARGSTRHSGAKRAVSDLHWFRYKNRQMVHVLYPEVCVSDNMVIEQVVRRLRVDENVFIEFMIPSPCLHIFIARRVVSHWDPQSNLTPAPAGYRIA